MKAHHGHRDAINPYRFYLYGYRRQHLQGGCLQEQSSIFLLSSKKSPAALSRLEDNLSSSDRFPTFVQRTDFLTSFNEIKDHPGNLTPAFF